MFQAERKGNDCRMDDYHSRTIDVLILILPDVKNWLSLSGFFEPKLPCLMHPCCLFSIGTGTKTFLWSLYWRFEGQHQDFGAFGFFSAETSLGIFREHQSISIRGLWKPHALFLRSEFAADQSTVQIGEVVGSILTQIWFGQDWSIGLKQTISLLWTQSLPRKSKWTWEVGTEGGHVESQSMDVQHLPWRCHANFGANPKSWSQHLHFAARNAHSCRPGREKETQTTHLRCGRGLWWGGLGGSLWCETIFRKLEVLSGQPKGETEKRGQATHFCGAQEFSSQSFEEPKVSSGANQLARRRQQFESLLLESHHSNCQD